MSIYRQRNLPGLIYPNPVISRSLIGVSAAVAVVTILGITYNFVLFHKLMELVTSESRELDSWQRLLLNPIAHATFLDGIAGLISLILFLSGAVYFAWASLRFCAARIWRAVSLMVVAAAPVGVPAAYARPEDVLRAAKGEGVPTYFKLDEITALGLGPDMAFLPPALSRSSCVATVSG